MARRIAIAFSCLAACVTGSAIAPHSETRRNTLLLATSPSSGADLLNAPAFDHALPSLAIALCFGQAVACVASDDEAAGNGGLSRTITAAVTAGVFLLTQLPLADELAWSPFRLIGVLPGTEDADVDGRHSSKTAAIALLLSRLVCDGPLWSPLWSYVLGVSNALLDTPLGRLGRTLVPRGELIENDCEVVKTATESLTAIVVSALGASRSIEKAAVGLSLGAATQSRRTRPIVMGLAVATADSQVEALVQRALPSAFQEPNVTEALTSAADGFPPFDRLVGLWEKAIERCEQRVRSLAPFALAAWIVGVREGRVTVVEAPRFVARLIPLTWGQYGPHRRLIRACAKCYRACVHDPAKRAAHGVAKRAWRLVQASMT